MEAVNPVQEIMKIKNTKLNSFHFQQLSISFSLFHSIFGYCNIYLNNQSDRQHQQIESGIHVAYGYADDITIMIQSFYNYKTDIDVTVPTLTDNDSS